MPGVVEQCRQRGDARPDYGGQLGCAQKGDVHQPGPLLLLKGLAEARDVDLLHLEQGLHDPFRTLFVLVLQ